MVKISALLVPKVEVRQSLYKRGAALCGCDLLTLLVDVAVASQRKAIRKSSADE
jgi:hypothetical protein